MGENVVKKLVMGYNKRMSGDEFKKQIEQNAEQGDADAQHNLGIPYYKGEGVTQDYEKAIFWWQKAAQQGLAEAQEALNKLNSPS